MQQYETSDALFITDYEEDSDLETAPCGSVSAEHFTMWTEEELADSESAMGKRENHAVRLKWKDTKAAYYEIALDEPMAMSHLKHLYKYTTTYNSLVANQSPFPPT